MVTTTRPTDCAATMLLVHTSKMTVITRDMPIAPDLKSFTTLLAAVRRVLTRRVEARHHKQGDGC